MPRFAEAAGTLQVRLARELISARLGSPLHEQGTKHRTRLARPDRGVVEDAGGDERVAIELVPSELVLGVADDRRVADDHGSEELVGVPLEGGAARSEPTHRLTTSARGEGERARGGGDDERGPTLAGDDTDAASVTVQDQLIPAVAEIVHSRWSRGGGCSQGCWAAQIALFCVSCASPRPLCYARAGDC